MPIPQPTGSETENDFISRCMANETMVSDFPDENQRYAVCIDQIKDKSPKLTIMSALAAFLSKLKTNK